LVLEITGKISRRLSSVLCRSNKYFAKDSLNPLLLKTRRRKLVKPGTSALLLRYGTIEHIPDTKSNIVSISGLLFAILNAGDAVVKVNPQNLFFLKQKIAVESAVFLTILSL
jgi:hypothetical protein